MTNRASRTAFTLIELLVAIAIVAILAALLLPVLASARRQGQINACASNEHQLGLSIGLYAADYDDFIPFASDPDNRHVVQVIGHSVYGDPLDSLIRNMPYDVRATLKPYGAIQDVFRCPLDKNWLYYAEPGHQPTFYQECGSSYQYDDNHALRGQALSGYPDASNNFLMGDYGGYHYGAALDPRGRLNVLFADFHVKTVTWTQRSNLLDSYP